MGRIDYFYNEQTDLEWILCRQSSLSYPLHSHASVFAIGIVLASAAMTISYCTGRRLPCIKLLLFLQPHCASAGREWLLWTEAQSSAMTAGR